MDDLFGDDFTTSVPAPSTINPLEATPAGSLDVVDSSLGLGMTAQTDLGGDLQPLQADPAESFITKEKVQFVA